MSGRHYAGLPSYDFLAPEEPSHPIISSKLNNSSAGPGISTLVELNAVKYELATLKDERERDKLQQQQELRELQQKLQEEAREREQERSDKNYLYEQQQNLIADLNKVKNERVQEKEAIARELRTAKTNCDALGEENEELRTQDESTKRRFAHQSAEMQSKIERTQLALDEAQSEVEALRVKTKDFHAKNIRYEGELSKLQSELSVARSQAGDQDTLQMLKRELSEQINHITNLEVTARKQSLELNQLKDYKKTHAILEEQNHALQLRIQVLDDLREQLSNTEIQLSTLQAEKLAWSSFLQDDERNLHFRSPEELVRSLLQERIDKAALTEQLGRMGQKEFEHMASITNLESYNIELKKQINQFENEIKSEAKTRQRLERQRTLALKEASFLREQLRNYVSEETMLDSTDGTQDPKAQRIQELEDLLDGHKKEIASLTLQLREVDTISSENTNGLMKRHRNGENEDREQAMGQMSRKLRSLQDELDGAVKENALALADIKSLQKRLAAAEATTQLRVLQLKDNPAERHEIVKQARLDSLKKENADLLAQLSNQANSVEFVPAITLANCRTDLKEMEGLVAEKEKRMMRLKEMWAKKALEFRQAVYSILGYEVDFQPNGRVKVKSMFHKSDFYGGIDTGIIFDGEQGTMKLSGGQNSQFAREIKNALDFYVTERKEIPCFLAAISLEGYEKTTRANR